METKISYDIGEEILAKLRKLNKILDRIIEAKYGKECTDPSCSGNSEFGESKRTGEVTRPYCE